MKDRDRIAILGGDLRQYTAALILNEKSWDVSLWGLDRSKREENNILFCNSLEEAIHDAKAVMLPLPASSDGVHLNCPLNRSGESVKLADIVSMLERDTLLIGGRMPPELLTKAEERGIRVRDYFLSEDFQIQNAYITAEAAVSIAMNSLDKNICAAKVAVTGFGRISKHLIRLLGLLGADITVVARKESDLAWGYSLGCSVIRIGDTPELRSNIFDLAHGFDIIYNTVPHWLFDREFLERVDKNTFIIDLASVPGGVDIRAAKELGANVLWATSLPGKYAPRSAGEIIAFCVDNILRSEVT